MAQAERSPLKWEFSLLLARLAIRVFLRKLRA